MTINIMSTLEKHRYAFQLIFINGYINLPTISVKSLIHSKDILSYSERNHHEVVRQAKYDNSW